MISEQTYDVRSRALVGIAVALLLTGLAQGATWTVSPDDKIQAAIDAASPGDTILIENGTFYENVNVTKTLILKGIGMPIIDAMGSHSAITLSEDGIWVEGLRATNASWVHAGCEVISSDNTIRGNNVDHNYYGIYLYESGNNTVEGNNVSYNWYGISLANSKNNNLSGNNASYNKDKGIYLSGSENNNLNGNNASYNKDKGIYLSGSKNNNLSGNNASYNEGDGISLWYSSENNNLSLNHASYNEGDGICIDIYDWDSGKSNLSGNNASYNEGYGITLSDSENIIMRNNSMSSNHFNFKASGYNDIDISNLVNEKRIYYLVNASNIVIDSLSNAGIMYCISCDNITLRDLYLEDNFYGIYFYNTTNSKILNTSISNNDYGIYLEDSKDNILLENRISNNEDYGIILSDSENNIMRNNSMLNNRFNFKVSGYNDIDISNLVNEKRIYYMINASDIVIDSSSNAGVMYCISCDNITLKDLVFKDNIYSIYFYNTTNSKILNTSLSNNDHGIYLEDSNDNILFGNSISNNRNDGILFEISNNNTIARNNIISNNENGIFFWGSYGNTITVNNINNNGEDGISLIKSDNNTILGNNVNFNHNGISILSSSYNNKVVGNNVNDNKNDAIQDDISNLNTSEFRENTEKDVKIEIMITMGPSSPRTHVEVPSEETLTTPTKNDDTEEPIKERPSRKSHNTRHEYDEDLYAEATSQEVYYEISGEKIKMWLGDLVFNPNEIMTVGVTEMVMVRIAKNETVENLKRGFAQDANISIDKIEVSDIMSVSLTGDKRFFSIERITEERQVIPDEGNTVWNWWVTPLEEGNHNLSLIVCPIINCEKKNTSGPKCCTPIERTITVEAIPPTNVITNFIKSEWKWIVGTIIAIIGAIATLTSLVDRWNSRKKRTQGTPKRKGDN